MFVEKMESELQCGNAKRYSFVLGERGNRVVRVVDYRRFLGVCKGVIHKEK
ncbi:hypothetical protein MICH65_0835 [Candidatus Chazhemtobacterium aquaticus]|jgi:hypothetical protein|uniref:Uncharacterized protein n=1 Tax=Candidatus Chazhemtobacterium aquaticus TaxID=2715735 RepID=A0A857N6Q2_9BACT|nr:hypothetical protein MICH65_0835 [Candidatus Chazhemtobacterium aquaticus]